MMKIKINNCTQIIESNLFGNLELLSSKRCNKKCIRIRILSQSLTDDEDIFVVKLIMQYHRGRGHKM